MYYYDEPYLAHYGVKGMKWGVRKARQAVGNAVHKLRQRRAGVRGMSSDTRRAERNFNRARRQFERVMNGGRRPIRVTGKQAAILAGTGAATAYSMKSMYDLNKRYKNVRKTHPNMSRMTALGYAQAHSNAGRAGVKAGQAIKKRKQK